MVLAGFSLGRTSLAARILVIGGGMLAGPVRSLFDDPFLDATCSDCHHSSLAVLADPATALVVSVVGLVATVAGLVVGAVSAPSIFRIALAVVVAAALPGTGLPEPAIAATACGIAVVAATATACRQPAGPSAPGRLGCRAGFR